MALIKSISGIRGTIGGAASEGLNPQNIVQFTAGFAAFTKAHTGINRPTVVVGRDARISGLMVRNIVVGTLQSMGCDVVDIDLATTPTTEMAVRFYGAQGGIILTASHNPKHWNALKLLTDTGEFLSAEQGAQVLALGESGTFSFAPVEELGSVRRQDALPRHIEEILALQEVDVPAIRAARLRVAYDAINSVGAVALPPLLKALGVEETIPLFAEPTGQFAHNPEPLPQHLVDLCQAVRTQGAHVGFSVDPDVDRLAIIDERGEPFGEEYTLVSVADYLLGLHGGGNTVSNMSSTRALRDVTERHGGSYSPAAVGEVNVVHEMHRTGALIGGEGNGGVIFPKLHPGRDALVGIALFLSHLAKAGTTVSELRDRYPRYEMCKERLDLPAGADPDAVLAQLARREAELGHRPNTIDGLKIDFPTAWVQVRKSNTEPIMRIYTEAPTAAEAAQLAARYKQALTLLL